MIIMIPALSALAGLLAYVLSSNAKVVEIGRIAFSCGLLVTLFVVAGSSIRILPA